jgi:hypothetical protein
MLVYFINRAGCGLSASYQSKGTAASSAKKAKSKGKKEAA